LNFLIHIFPVTTVLLYLFYIMNQLKVATYNVHGVNDVTLSYINNAMSNYDFLLVQEHWLQNSQLHIFEDKIDNIHAYGISGMNESEITPGRPYGGCAILWRNSLSCRVTPIPSDNNRLCMAKVELQTHTVLLCTVYMPCDTEYDQSNIAIYNDVLYDLLNIVNNENIEFVLCGGDFNTDMLRVKSLHTTALHNFMSEESFKLVSHNCIDYTYESASNGVKSIIDHFMISENLCDSIFNVHIKHDIDNISDHSILAITLVITVQYAHVEVQNEAKLMWTSASEHDIACYKAKLDQELHGVYLDPSVLYCNNPMCTDHHDYIELLHNTIIKCCLTASECIPTRSTVHLRSKKSVPGWKEYVKPYRSDAMFWHVLWKDNGCPKTGYVADIRRKTRYKYHSVLRKVKQHEKEIQAIRMAENADSCQYSEFWNNIKKIRGNTSRYPSTVDGTCGAEHIASLFRNKYDQLYNCVSFDVQQMAALKDGLSASITDHYITPSEYHHAPRKCGEHLIMVSDILDAVNNLKRGKHDGNRGYFSDHIMNGTPRLHVQLSLLFNSMLSHGYVPKDFLLSTLVPIPKNKRKSLNNSDNYRAIALSSILGKLLDKILLFKCNNAFQTSDLQYGFKQKHSTNQCTFVVNEVLQYYANNNSNTLLTLIDASKAFDRVHYVKLFKLLISKNICPVVARFLTILYTNQTFRVKWCSHVTELTQASNGVKQGGVMSPLLFTLYIDEMLLRLKKCGYGCFIGNMFYGALGYADDVILLSPTVYGMQHLLHVCARYGEEYNVLFNPDKTKLIHVKKIKCSISNISFMGKSIARVEYEKHLGFPIGNVNTEYIVTHAINEFIVKVNMVKSHFKLLPPNIMYKLFKTYCMPLYGCPLWDYSNKIMCKFYVAWRKAIRSILCLPRRTHCYLLNEICHDMSINDQLNSRFIRFFNSLISSTNKLTNRCATLALRGSNSNISNNILIASNRLNIPRDKFICVMSCKKLLFPHSISDTASLICDLLHTRYNYKFIPAGTEFLLNSDVQYAIDYLCTT